MKKTVIAMMFFMFMLISTNSFASDIFGYWKSDEKPPFDIVFLSAEKFYPGKQRFNVIRVVNDSEEYIIFIVNEKHKITEKEKAELKKLSNNEMRMRMITHIIVQKNGDSIVVSTMAGKKIKYTRISKEIYDSLAN